MAEGSTFDMAIKIAALAFSPLWEQSSTNLSFPSAKPTKKASNQPVNLKILSPKMHKAGRNKAVLAKKIELHVYLLVQKHSE